MSCDHRQVREQLDHGDISPDSCRPCPLCGGPLHDSEQDPHSDRASSGEDYGDPYHPEHEHI